jgi:BirA family biotin operon repressor/biotin-[acetyl-CoA-carboxylase] ligase
MHIIKLDAIDSTNLYLKQLSTDKTLEDNTVVVAEKQTQGRGQMGTQWEAETGKNLTVSIYKRFSGLPLERQFYVSVATSLALTRALSYFTIPRLSIKWPNDILSDNKKICGVLIENVIKQDQLIASVIGIGLNVNQMVFNSNPKASSMRLINGSIFTVEEVMQKILAELEISMQRLKVCDFERLKLEYETELFRKNKPSTFKNIEGVLFSGFIQSVSQAGNLQVLLEDNIIKEFGLKDLTLLY